MRNKLVFVLAAGVLSFCFAACSGSGKDKDDEPDVCITCDLAGVRCHLGQGLYQDVCAADETLAAITCSEYGGVWEIVPLCPLEPSETDGSDNEPWDPGGSVTFDRDAGEYVIDQQAFEQLKRDPTLLLDDSSQLRELESGYFEVVRAGDLTNALGWSTGDVLLLLDGHALQGLEGLAAVYSELADNTTFELTIQRGRAELLLRYRVQ